MNKKIFLLFIFILSCVFQTSNAIEKIAYVDVDYILNKSNKGIEIYKELEEENQKIITLLKIKEKEIKDDESKLKKTQNVISEEEFKKKVKILNDKVKKFRIQKKKLVKEFNKKKKEDTMQLIKLINPIIEDYLKINSINIVFDKRNIYIGSNSSDITSQIFDLVNTNIK